MASAPQLPLFYNGLEPLSSETHAAFRVKPATVAPFLINTHAVPLTVEEFPLAQRFTPIVFSSGDDPVPLALMGLNEGVNATEAEFYAGWMALRRDDDGMQQLAAVMGVEIRPGSDAF